MTEFGTTVMITLGVLLLGIIIGWNLRQAMLLIGFARVQEDLNKILRYTKEMEEKLAKYEKASPSRPVE